MGCSPRDADPIRGGGGGVEGAEPDGDGFTQGEVAFVGGVGEAWDGDGGVGEHGGGCVVEECGGEEVGGGPA